MLIYIPGKDHVKKRKVCLKALQRAMGKRNRKIRFQHKRRKPYFMLCSRMVISIPERIFKKVLEEYRLKNRLKRLLRAVFFS